MSWLQCLTHENPFSLILCGQNHQHLCPRHCPPLLQQQHLTSPSPELWCPLYFWRVNKRANFLNTFLKNMWLLGTTEWATSQTVHGLVTIHSFFLFLSSSLHRGCMPSSLFSRWTKSFTCVSPGILFFTKGLMTSRVHRLLSIHRVACKSRLKSGTVALVSLLLCECGIGNKLSFKSKSSFDWVRNTPWA